MRLLSFTFLLVLCLAASSAQSQAPAFQNVNRQINAALAAGRGSEISRFFGAATIISVDGVRTICSRSHCSVIVTEFFNKHPAEAFATERSGLSGSAYFTIGTLRTTTGNYQVYYLIREESGSVVIQELRVDS